MSMTVKLLRIFGAREKTRQAHESAGRWWSEPRAEKKRRCDRLMPPMLSRRVGSTGGYCGNLQLLRPAHKAQTAVCSKCFATTKAAVEGFSSAVSDPAGVRRIWQLFNHGPQAALRPAWWQARGNCSGIRGELWTDSRNQRLELARKQQNVTDETDSGRLCEA